MAVLRAVENGFALGRSGRNGLLILNNNRCLILAEAATVPAVLSRLHQPAQD
jgi:hypothetical protein